ncbi:MAG: magnesium transporter [Hyphomicrobiaceae bacterium]
MTELDPSGREDGDKDREAANERDDTETEIDRALFAAAETAIEAGDAETLKALVGELDDPDLADLIALLQPDERTGLIGLLGADFRPSVLSELDWHVKEQIVEALPNEQIAEAVRELDTADAVYLIEDMEDADKKEILAHLPADERATIERSLEYPEDSAGRLMRSEFIAVAPFWTVGQTIDHMRETEDLPDSFTEIFVVDPTYHLIGVVQLDRLLRTKRPVTVAEIMDAEPDSIAATLDQEEVGRQFERYNLMSMAVVDANGRLVGVVTADDVVEIIQEEAEEDIMRLGGVGDEEVSDAVLSITRSRFLWLLVNLGTAILASAVIKQFDATIEQMVALAVLMPIVASMGGNAGTQTMTVAVRALATRDLTAVNAFRVIVRETTVGLINGLLFAILMGVVAVVWFGSRPLGLVIGAAMIVNHVAAALAGILVPIALDRLKLDPAVSSGVFVTTVTDVVGFFAFLGLAALWLAH